MPDMGYPGPSELEPAQPPPWPWRELNELADHLAREIAGGVTRIMREAGEDPASQQMFDLRCRQAAHGLGRQASRIRVSLIPPELPPALADSAFGRSGCRLIDGKSLLAARSRGSAAECAADAASLLREDDTARARDLLKSALHYLDRYETRKDYPA